MKKIVCEICEGNSFLKKDGQFICQNCGTAYTAEEVKGMMQELAEDVSADTPQDAAVPNQKLINLLVMAGTAFEAGKLAEAEKYCTRAIEMDETCYSAWFLKAKVAGWGSVAEDQTLNEAVKYFFIALDSAPEAERDTLKKQSAEELARIGMSMVAQSGKRFAADPSTFTLFDITENAENVMDALNTLLGYGEAEAVPGYILTEIATLMNQAGASALEGIHQKWKAMEHPGKQEFETVKACYDSIDGLFQKVLELSADDEQQMIAAYRNMIAAQEALVKMQIFRQEKKQETGELVWVASNALSDLEITAKRMWQLKYKNNIAALEEAYRKRKEAEAAAAEEAKRQRIKAYWETHAEEKAQLDTELETLSQQKKQITEEIAELNGQIETVKLELRQSLPQDAEIEKLKAEIRDLNKSRMGVGLFNLKGQKEVNAKIEPLKAQKDALELQAKAERKRIKEDVKLRTESLKSKITALKNSHTAAENRQSAIHAILTKDPGEEA